MPNWAYTNVAVKGTKKEIHNVIKLGLVNSGVEESAIPENLREAFDLFLKEGKVKSAKTVGDDYATRQVVGIELKEGITMQTLFPIPDSYILYDTTNHPNSAPEEVLAEQEGYGAIGWYDYNHKYLGTKWDADLEDLDLNESVVEGEDWATLTFHTATAWSLPDAFFARLTEKFHDLVVIAEGTEESCAYYIVVVFKDGEGYDYCDLTDDFKKVCDEYHKKRDKLKEEGKTDEEIDEEIGEWCDDNNIVEMLDAKFEEAIEKLGADTDIATSGTEE